MNSFSFFNNHCRHSYPVFYLQKDFPAKSLSFNLRVMAPDYDSSRVSAGDGDDDPTNDPSTAGASATPYIPYSGRTNDEYLSSAKALQQKTTEQLNDGLRIVIDTREVATAAAETLSGDKEKMTRISKGLDVIDSELFVARKLLVRIAKRIYTDKILIALTLLVLVAIVAIIIFATLHPGQPAFNVPDEIKPPASVTESLKQSLQSIEDAVPQ
jgi:hypothetical protein